MEEPTYLGTVKLVVRTGDLSAVGLVGAVSAVLKKREIELILLCFGDNIPGYLVSVTSPPRGNTQTVLTPELATVAGREI